MDETVDLPGEFRLTLQTGLSQHPRGCKVWVITKIRPQKIGCQLGSPGPEKPYTSVVESMPAERRSFQALMEVGLQADVTCHLVKGWHLKVPLRRENVLQKPLFLLYFTV